MIKKPKNNADSDDEDDENASGSKPKKVRYDSIKTTIRLTDDDKIDKLSVYRKDPDTGEKSKLNISTLDELANEAVSRYGNANLGPQQDLGQQE